MSSSTSTTHGDPSIGKEGISLSREPSARSVSTVASSGSSSSSSDRDEQMKHTKPGHRDSSLLRSGVIYGSVSLALVVLAGATSFPHYQAKLAELKCDSLCQGGLTSARSTLTLIGATVVGRLSDQSGLPYNARKLCLVVGCIASAVGVVLSLRATSISEMWIAMVPTALLQQNFNVLKALFGDYHVANPPAETTNNDANVTRANSVGMLGMAAGLAFMVGPLTGSSILKTYEHSTIFGLICLALALGITLGPLPSVDHTVPEKAKDFDSSKPADESVYRSLVRKLVPDLVPAVRTAPGMFLMTARILMGLAFHIFQTIWMDVLRTRFQFGPSDYGRYFGFIGLSFALSQGFGAKLLLQYFGRTPASRTRLMLVCASLLGGGRAIVYQTESLVVVYCVYGAIIVALGVMNTIFTADAGAIAKPHELGGLFGILASVESLAGIIGPVLGGLLARVHATRAPMAAVLCLYGAVFVMVYFGYERCLAEPKKSHTKSD